MGCFDNCVKYLLFVTNLLIFILACVILGLGIWVLVDQPSFVDLLDKLPNGESIPIYSSAVILFIIVAVSAIIISFFGCCGAYKESKCMLTAYFLMVLTLLVLITVGAVVGLTQVVGNLKENFIDSLAKYDKNSNNNVIKEIVAIWDEVQQENSCCGVNIFKDWSEYNQRYKNGGNGQEVEDNNNVILLDVRVPESCCRSDLSVSNKAKCQRTPSSANGGFIVGCFTVVEEQINSHSNIIGITAIAVIIVMIANMLIALYMCTCAATDDRDAVARPKKRLYTNPGQGQGSRV